MSIESGLGRLHQPAPAGLVDAVELAVGLRLGFGIYPSPIGEVAVIFGPDGVKQVRLPVDLGPDLVEALPPPGWDTLIRRALELGRPGELPLDLMVSPFRRRVLEAAAEIPRGEVRSYGWLARRLGRERAARAVGSAMAANPVPLIIPCHRVIRSDGHLGQYSLGGPENKRILLQAEKVTLTPFLSAE